MKKFIVYNKIWNYYTIMSENRKNRIEKNFWKNTTDWKVYEYSASLERFMTENGFIVVTDEIEEKARDLVLIIKNLWK